MPSAANPAPREANLALRPNLSPRAAWPTRPRLIAPIAGPRMQLAAECSTLAANTTANTGHAANMNALAASAITANAATTRSERAASTKAPPGIWPIRATRPPMVRTSPISPCVHFCSGQIDRDQGTEAHLSIGEEEHEPVQAMQAIARRRGRCAAESDELHPPVGTALMRLVRFSPRPARSSIAVLWSGGGQN